MALAAKRRVVVNAGRRKTNRSRRRNLSAKQIKWFGTPAQKAALKSSRRRKANSSRARNTASRSRSYLPRKKHRARSKNPGEILSLVLNPGGRKKGHKNMAAKNMKRSRAAKRAYRRRMRAKANPSHYRPKHRRRTKARSNPSPRRRYSRRSNHRRRHARRPNAGGSGKFMQGVMFLVGGGVGFFGSKALTQMVMSSNNTGVTGYFGNAAATAAIALVAHMLPPTRKFSPAIIAGGVLQIIYRVLTDNTQLGQVLSSTGMGDYQMQNFVTPQRLIAPLDSAQIEMPTGWGASAPMAIATAAPPGAPPPGMHGYNTQGFGHGLYSPQGLYS